MPSTLSSLIGILLLFSMNGLAKELAVTFDDPNLYPSPKLTAGERDQRLRDQLRKYRLGSRDGLKAALFVCGMRIDSAEGKSLLAAWDKEGHILGNHTYSHRSLHSKEVTAEAFEADLLKTEPFLRPLAHFQKLFRFPFLKEGDTKEKRDHLRAFLKEHHYRQGAVSIDASDWYIDSRLRARLAKEPGADLKGYRTYYLEHLWERAQFYDELAGKALGRSPKHILLLHHNLLNALYLSDVLTHFQSKGWKWIAAEDAFTDELYAAMPNALPAGESILWAKAKAAGTFDAILRYPGESEEYEKEKMDTLGL